jgi:hypothetical protein
MQELAEGIETEEKDSQVLQRDLKRGTILSALDFHIGENDEFKVLTNKKHIVSNT